MKNTEVSQYILGLDIGANSVGWAILERDGTSAPTTIVQTGAKIFEAGLEGGSQADLQAIQAGKGKSRGVARREARLTRRRLGRVTQRLNRAFRLLQRAGLLPSSGSTDDRVALVDAERRAAIASERHRVLTGLQRDLTATWQQQLRAEGRSEEDIRKLAQILPYFLRARALDHKLDSHELGLVLYHLGQRRGFLSNRKSTPKKEDDGKVKKALGELAQKIENAGARTLGEYFSTLDPTEERIRKRYTHRRMYEHEFEMIWESQEQHCPDTLTPRLKKEVHRAIFYQRPLKWDRRTIGNCRLEPGHKRAPMALLSAQRYRFLDKLNNLLIAPPGGAVDRPLTPDERAAVLDALETKGDLTFAKLRKLLRLSRAHGFNLQTDGEKKIPGNRTAAALIKVFGRKRWEAFSDNERDRIVEDVRSMEKEDALAARGRKAWGLDEKQAEAFGKLRLEPGEYSRLSRLAIRKVLPGLEQGVPYPTVRNEIYGAPPPTEPVDALPRLSEALGDIRNPVVSRALTELRKVVNAVIRRYGKPEMIRVELARDLRKTKKQREDTSKKNRANQRTREKAAECIRKEMGNEHPSREDILKVVLREECNRECPYTGKRISMQSLLGDHPQFDIEHIIPFSKCRDDSYMNKTLCDVEENRSVKRNRTPFETYAGTRQRYKEILDRVRAFKGRAGRVKLQRFLMTEKDIESIDDFSSRQLNDTRYASRLATEYLGLLYGGLTDKDHKQRIQVNRGGTTAYFRWVWELNGILGADVKSRDDHRHHAVDAVVVALVGPGKVKMLSEAATRAPVGKRKLFGRVEPPWPGFLNEAYESIEQITVSHSVSRKVNGPLHKKTVYGPPRKDDDGKTFVRMRRPLEKLTTNELKEIVDPAVKTRVLAKLKELDQKEPKKAFALPENHPFMQTKDGGTVPIHKVRIAKVLATVNVGSDAQPRHVKPGSNHHLEILEITDAKGRKKWDAEMVTRLEAMRRLRNHEPVIKRDHGEGKTFRFSLAPGESIETDDKGKRSLFHVRSVNQAQGQSPRVEYVYINDARKKSDIRKSREMSGGKGKDWRTPQVDSLRILNCQKVVITPLGEVRRAKD